MRTHLQTGGAKPWWSPHYRAPVPETRVRDMAEAIIGSLAAVFGALIGAWAALKARTPSEAKVEVVDVALVPGGCRYVRDRASGPACLTDIWGFVRHVRHGGVQTFQSKSLDRQYAGFRSKPLSTRMACTGLS
ncbi:hypothetical protein GCM10012286_33660 [Streptomyces lasiicapitis]|uniref:Uncharacterized protein n=1 Tax=Streptomyces lasiicapitis TaxID=1923961 RepID=A0ABQ2M321_9ACTN|nr:hypothetical protein GCM10012286_33660 [Streptomyces lasiicapitis]